MARWSKRLTVLAGGLVSVVGWLAPASAQNPGYQPPVIDNRPAEPIGFPTADAFPRLGAAPAPQPGPPPSPLSLEERRYTPNGFSEGEYYPQPDPYVLKLKGEYMFWHVGMPRLTTVVATSSNNPNLANGVGAFADPGTTILLGPGFYDYHEIHGGRFTAGLATGVLPPVEISGFWIDRPSVSLVNSTSNGSQNAPVLARPFQATNLPSINGLGPQVVLSGGFPGFLAGNIKVNADLSLWGVEPNVLFNLGESDRAGLDLILGYRYTDLSESLTLSNSLRSINNALFISFNSVNPLGLPPGFTSVAADSFRTRNQFNGGTIGLRPALYVNQFTTTVDLKLAIGSTRQTLNISGESTLTSPDGSVQSVPGGLLAVASNSGQVARDAFSVIPEININVGFNITRTIKLFATYNIFYWSSVVRPGDQLNNRVDSRQVPTDPTFDASVRATQPGPSFAIRDLWGHGVSVGVEIGF